MKILLSKMIKEEERMGVNFPLQKKKKKKHNKKKKYELKNFENLKLLFF